MQRVDLQIRPTTDRSMRIIVHEIKIQPTDARFVPERMYGSWTESVNQCRLWRCLNRVFVRGDTASSACTAWHSCCLVYTRRLHTGRRYAVFRIAHAILLFSVKSSYHCDESRAFKKPGSVVAYASPLPWIDRSAQPSCIPRRPRGVYPIWDDARF